MMSHSASCNAYEETYKMGELIQASIKTYVGAIFAVLDKVGLALDARKIWWCSYPVIDLEYDELMEKVERDRKKLIKEAGRDLYVNELWYVGIPEFKLVRRGVAHLTCNIDLYYVACDTTDGYRFAWCGKLIPKADKFEVPLCLITPLIDALSRGEMETDDAHIVERTSSHSVYDFMGREWKIPDAFLGFIWALRDKGEGFESLLDAISCSLMEKFTKELPSPEIQKLPTGSYQDLVEALRNLGSNKTEAEEKANYIMQKYPDVSLEEKIRHALND
jgi:hypothetical protein